MKIQIIIYIVLASMAYSRNPLQTVSGATDMLSYARRFLSRGSTTNGRSVAPVAPVVPPVEKPSRLARVAETTSQGSLAIAGVGTLIKAVFDLAPQVNSRIQYPPIGLNTHF